MSATGDELPSRDLDESIDGPPSSSSSLLETADKCHDNSSQLSNYKEIMLKNQFDMKKKEEEVQEYAEKLTKIKSKVKLSRRSAESSIVGTTDSILNVKKENDDDDDDGGNEDKSITDELAKTPKAKSHLLQKKLAENRRVFQQRNKKLFESKRAVEEKVEEIRQQINDTDLSIGKDKKFIELNDKINELQATVIDLQDNLKEKDSVIDSKTRAITLMSEDLSKKGKTTLDTLEETKCEMRLMQENFIQLELSFKTKIDHLINQLEEKEQNLDKIQRENETINILNKEKDNRINELEVKTQELINVIDNYNVKENDAEENDKNMEKLKREMEESNKNMIKMKAQHKSKLRQLQKRLENFRTMSDANAEVVKLENQVALLEEEKGNLQLSLVDFDELKASYEELQQRINELDNRTITQMNEIQMHIEAIATLENQKLDLIQELHGVKQEMIALENENAELENLRVTAELKIVELEEQLEKSNNKQVIDNDNAMVIDDSVQSEKIEGIDKKSTDSTGSTESFERIMDASDGGIAVSTTEAAQSDEILQLNGKISHLTEENIELVIKLTKIQEKMDENENWREKFSKLAIENEELVDNNRKNYIDQQTSMSLESEIANLKELLNKKHEENEKLINDLAIHRENIKLMEEELRGKISSLELELLDRNTIIKSLENVIEEKVQMINELEMKISDNHIEINELNGIRMESNALIEGKMLFYNDLERELRETIEKLEMQVKNGEEIRKNMDEKSTEMQLELEQMKILIDEYLLEKANQGILTSKLSADNETLTLINSNVNKKIDDLTVKETKLIQKIEDLELTNEKYINEIDEKNIAINELELKFTNINEEHLINIDTLEKRLEEINEELNRENDRNKQNAIGNKELMEDYNKELGEQNERLLSMKVTNDELLQKNFELQNEIEAMVKHQNKLSTDLFNNENLRMKLTEELDTNMKEISTIKESYVQLEEKLQELMLKYNEKSNLYEQLSIEMQNQSEYYANTKQELSNTYNMMEQLKINHQEDMTTLNQQLQSAIHNLNDEIEKNRELNIRIEEKEDFIRHRLTPEVDKVTLESQIAALQSDLEEANNNTQAQLHKMKIIAANLKKKSGQCQELEMKLREIEEKWTIEKRENEEMNEKIYSLNKIKEENEQVLNKVILNLKNAEVDYDNEKTTRDKLMAEFEDYKEKSATELMEKDQELVEVTERARELGVRMQVMEAEYLDQLNIINRSETEHRLLLSKLSQVNELLENTKIESAEQKNNLESLRAHVDEIEKEKSNEIEEKTKIINNLMIERDELEVKLNELSLKLDVYKRENEELTNKFEELTQKHELSMIKENIIETSTSSPPSAETDEVLFNATKCFSTTSNWETSENNEILNLKQLLNDQRNAQTIIENENTRLNGELSQLKLQINDLIADSEKSKTKIDDNESVEAIKLDEDEEEWSWNAKEAEIQLNMGHLHPFSSTEMQLNAKIAELEDTINDISNEKLRLNDELNLIQTKNGKLIRKLKEYKIQHNNLQQQLKIQLTSGGLCDLDSAIEEELKSQVAKLEKNLVEMKSDNEKITAERDNLLKKIDVLLAANERFTDMKERQDRDLEVMYIRNDELMRKIQLLEVQCGGKPENLVLNSEKNQSTDIINNEKCNRCEEKIPELQESVNLLAAENEELRQLIEQHRNKLAEKSNEIEANKIQAAEELKVNFYDMLEKSHNIEKQCLDTLEETNREKESLEEKYRLDLIEANEKIRELEENIMEKMRIFANLESSIEDCRTNVDEKIMRLEEANKKIEELETNLKNEMATKQTEVQLLEKTIQDLRCYSDELNNELANIKDEMVELKIHHEEEIATKELRIQNLEDNLEIDRCKIQKQTDESSELLRQLEEMKENSNINMERIRILEENNSKIKIPPEECEKLETDNKEIEQKLTEVNENMATVTELLNVRVQEVADLKQYIQRLEFDKLALENCSVNIDDLNRKLIDKDNEIMLITSKSKLQMDEKLQEILDFQSKLSILNLERDEYYSKLNNQTQEIKSLKESINNSEILITTIKTQMLSKDDEISRQTNIIASSNNEIQRLTAIIDNLESSIAQIRNELTEKNGEIIKLQANNTELISTSQQNNEAHKTIEKQLVSELSVKDEEIEDLKYVLNESTYPTIIQQLQNKIDTLYEEKSQLEQSLLPNLKNLSERQEQNVKQIEINNANTSELDIALYMLHQRDVRCEELTHELMQLLEERDTLQLRLSNAIRVNEELGKISIAPVGTLKNDQVPDDGSTLATNQETLTAASDSQPTLPIATQSANSDEEKKILAQKLSQLRNVGHRKDVRLLDDRELRNTQQMSLIAHKDALSTLPPDAAARLINANCTLSRDVQSQSSVLLNWLWGKSTPKVVHM